MNKNQLTLPGATGLGAAGFAGGLGGAGAAYGAANIFLRDFNASLIAGVAALALAGAIGGATMGLRSGRPHMLRAGLAAAVGLGSGLYLTEFLYSAFLAPSLRGDVAVTFVYVMRFALIGAWVGILLSAAQRDWPRLAEFALAGAMGFGLGSLFLDLAGRMLNGPIDRLVPGYTGDAAHDGMALALTWGIAFALAGIVAGASLGQVLDRAKAKRA